ncbi:hypothetical protein [Nocardioides pyridinolyticus]
MRTYRTVWQATVVVLTIVAVTAGAADLGWPSMLAAVGAITVLGAASGLAWVEATDHRWRLVGLLALWFGVGATLFLGLPAVVGVWTLLVVAMLGGLCPRLLGWVVEKWLSFRPVNTRRQLRRLSTRDLERRWLRTTQEVTRRRSDSAAVLVLVHERVRLLDELERRDPLGFDAMLVRTGWRERQDR